MRVKQNIAQRRQIVGTMLASVPLELPSVRGYHALVQLFSGVGRALRALRKAADLTQQQVADRAGLHVTTVNRAELEERPPDLTTVDALLMAIGVGVHDLARALDQVNGRSATEEIAEPDGPLYGTADELVDLYPEAPQAVLEDFISAAKRSQAAEDALQVALRRLKPYKRS